MGAARSGSTLLGTLMGQAPDVLFAGELTDWPGRGGRASIPRSVPFWEEVRTMVAVPPTAAGLKQVFDHPADLGLAAFLGQFSQTGEIEVTLMRGESNDHIKADIPLRRTT